MILVIDNFDSFVHNLARYLRQLGQATTVVRNDDPVLLGLDALRPKLVVISPGPKTPEHTGYCRQVAQRLLEGAPGTPLIGVCLGHQLMIDCLGGRVERGQPVHGRTSTVQHAGHPMFADLPTEFRVCRYHSLVARPPYPQVIEPTAFTTGGELMAFSHRNRNAFGLQFHPEAILSEYGYRILANLLQLCGCPVAEERVRELETRLFAGPQTS